SRTREQIRAWDAVVQSPSAAQAQICRGRDSVQRGEACAENHSIPVVRRQGRRGGELLYFHFQKLENSEAGTVWRRGAGAERIRDDGDFPTRRAKIHGAEWRSALHFFSGHIVLCRLRDAD